MNEVSRRQVLASACHAATLVGAMSLISTKSADAQSPTTSSAIPPLPMRCINIINFLRGNEPRSPVDLLEPVREQMKLIVDRRLPATWLLQFDALIDPRFVPFLRQSMPADHEVGLWFEMNRPHCEAAKVEWRGRPGLIWDSHPSVAFTIGYSPDERRRLADVAMNQFKAVFGFFPKSVASWNLDSITVAHLAEHYGIDAVAVCRDQIATDGFTIWGAPIAGYFPSKNNLWSPATDVANQLCVPVLRMLGQDPVYYYENEFPLPDGRTIHEPDTMEPVWTSGRSERFMDAFLEMIAHAPTGQFGYAQLGQENNFGWDAMRQAYPVQLDKLVHLRESRAIQVETMGDTGRRFKRAFEATPSQCQIMLADPFGNAAPACRTLWYQSRFYRANLHIKDDLPYLRDLTVYADDIEQPNLHEATRDHELQQRMPAILDGYHWRKAKGDRRIRELGETELPPACGLFLVNGRPLRLVGEPVVTQESTRPGGPENEVLCVELPVGDGRKCILRFEPDAIVARFVGQHESQSIQLAFIWDPAKSLFVSADGESVTYRAGDREYGIRVEGAAASKTDHGWKTSATSGLLRLKMAAQTRSIER